MGEGHQWISDSCHPYAVGFLRAGGWNIQTYLIRLLLLFAPSCTEWRLPSIYWKIRSGQSFFVRSWTAGLPVLHSCCPSGYCRLTERPADILPVLCCKQGLCQSCCYALPESISVLSIHFLRKDQLTLLFSVWYGEIIKGIIDVHDLCDHTVCFLSNRAPVRIWTDGLYEFCKRPSSMDLAAGDFKISAFVGNLNPP